MFVIRRNELGIIRISSKIFAIPQNTFALVHLFAINQFQKERKREDSCYRSKHSLISRTNEKSKRNNSRDIGEKREKERKKRQ